jgi:hypothetical protein
METAGLRRSGLRCFQRFARYPGFCKDFTRVLQGKGAGFPNWLLGLAAKLLKDNASPMQGLPR